METKHTPGPWVIALTGPFGDDVEITAPDRLGQVEIALVARGAPRGEPNAIELEQEANARLIAAAPDLVDALRRILNPPPGVEKLPPWVYGIAVPAIAKAEDRP